MTRAPEPADDLEGELTADERELLDELATGIVRRRLAAPALFFLESSKPLGFLASQAMIFFAPLASIVWTGLEDKGSRWRRAQGLLERRGGIELLLRRIESKL